MLVAIVVHGNVLKLILTKSMSKKELTTKSVPISPVAINSRWKDPFVAISKNHEKTDDYEQNQKI